MATYPTSLPCNLQHDNQSSHGVSFIRSEFIYNTRQRKTKCAVPTFTASFNYTQAEYDIFRAFYEADLNEGTREFKCNWLVHGIVSNNKVVRFTTPYTFKNMGNGVYRVAGNFELLEKGI